VQRRIETFYKPYHAAVAEAIEAAQRHFSQVWHVNCHSMPSFSTAKSPEGPGQERPEFVLGDRDGTTANPEFTKLVRETLIGFGYQVTVNDPYKGAELVRAYSDPAAGRHSLQIEIKRDLYMDEATIQPNAGFEGLRTNITRLIEVIRDYAATKT
jgi:N-formylglutamate amidohydrolase